MQTAPRRYKVYWIPKKNGRGSRIIAHPAREVKALQRALIALGPTALKVHPCATAYERGTSILKNAQVHKNSSILARFDIVAFFNSIKSNCWVEYLKSVDCDEEFVDISSSLFFWKPRGSSVPCLSVGAPSSPFASNRFMFSFDEAMMAYCSERDMCYTRYADDIAISSNDDIDMKEMEKVLVAAFPLGSDFKLNKKKTRVSGLGQRRSITGLIVNDDQRVSIGRRRKRAIEAMVHAYSKNRSGRSLAEIKGHLSFLRMVDKGGYERIRKKYLGRVNVF